MESNLQLGGLWGGEVLCFCFYSTHPQTWQVRRERINLGPIGQEEEATGWDSNMQTYVENVRNGWGLLCLEIGPPHMNNKETS